jgi:hypothetical protein
MEISVYWKPRSRAECLDGPRALSLRIVSASFHRRVAAQWFLGPPNKEPLDLKKSKDLKKIKNIYDELLAIEVIQS